LTSFWFGKTIALHQKAVNLLKEASMEKYDLSQYILAIQSTTNPFASNKKKSKLAV